MTKRGRGRPMKEPDDLVTLDIAIERMRDFLVSRYGPTTGMALCLAKGTIYNKIYRKEIHAWKRSKLVLVSEKEILKLVS